MPSAFSDPVFSPYHLFLLGHCTTPDPFSVLVFVMAAVQEGQSSRGSSPMSSPPQGLSDTISVAPAQPQFLRPGDVAFPQLSHPPQPHSAASTSTDANAKATPSHDTTTEKVKRPRKKKDPDAVTIKKVEAPKEKKPRKPRAPKDPSASTAGARKKQKTDASVNNTPTANRQPTLGDMVGKFQTPLPPAPSPQQSQPAQVMKEEKKPIVAPPHPARPASSGQRYDPIRASMTVDPYSTPAVTSTSSLQVSPRAHRASASPAIASLINPPAPNDTAMSPPAMPSTHVQNKQQSVTSAMPPPPTINRQPEAQMTPSVLINRSPQTISHPPALVDDAMEVDSLDDQKPAQTITKPNEKEKDKDVSKPAAKSTSAPAPKAKRASPPAATGSGLLSNSDLFGGPSAVTEDHKRHGVNIDLDIPLNPNGNNTINIAHEILKKYGKNAINPRAAAHRERLLQVAAAANRLEPGTGDDMSVDLNSEAENDSNVEMGGMEEEKKGEDEPKKRRRRKVEDYDKEDDFIDDTELAWEEGAAVAKDGFFVYSGPLVPEGEKAQIETYVLHMNCSMVGSTDRITALHLLDAAEVAVVAADVVALLVSHTHNSQQRPTQQQPQPLHPQPVEVEVAAAALEHLASPVSLRPIRRKWRPRRCSASVKLPRFSTRQPLPLLCS